MLSCTKGKGGGPPPVCVALLMQRPSKGPEGDLRRKQKKTHPVPGAEFAAHWEGARYLMLLSPIGVTRACPEKMLLPGAQGPSTGVGGAGLLLEVVGTSGLLALLARPLDRKSRTTEREKAV